MKLTAIKSFKNSLIIAFEMKGFNRIFHFLELVGLVAINCRI